MILESSNSITMIIDFVLSFAIFDAAVLAVTVAVTVAITKVRPDVVLDDESFYCHPHYYFSCCMLHLYRVMVLTCSSCLVV